MHYAVFYYLVLGLLPVLLVSAVSALDYSDASSLTVGRAIQSLYRDENSAQASFFVPCLDCFGGLGESLNQSFLFNFEAFPSDQPCGVNNISLNGIPLVQDWESTGIHGQGSTLLNSSGHALNAFVTSDCLQGAEQEGDEDETARSQLLTLTFQKIDQEKVQTLTGFTLSFKQHPRPELLRLSLQPEYKARDLPDSETWRDPPQSLRIPVSTPIEAESPSGEERPLSLEEQLEELQALEAQANALVELITQKKEFINSQFPGAAQGLKQEIKECDSFLCVVKAIGQRVHNAAHAAYIRFHESHQAYAHWSASAGGQVPTMIHSNGVTAPEQCHTQNSRPTERPPPYRGPLTVSSNEKAPARNSSEPQPEEPKWRDAHDPSMFIIVLKFIAVITGLAFLFSLLRRCCISDRRRVERAAERERRATERLYKCAARKQSWRDWWSGRKRGKPGYRQGDYEEKRGLILQQEHILEGAMQDEIQQLRIQEEIRQLRQTRDAVDDLVRAEEGRNVLPRYSSSSRHYVPRPAPAPITIPSATSRMYPSHHQQGIDDDHPPSPLSRTSSLPDYKTDGSEPPGYESDRRSSFSSQGGFSEYAHSIRTTTSQWSPDSSIPDLSPRPSMETAVTGETARTFL